MTQDQRPRGLLKELARETDERTFGLAPPEGHLGDFFSRRRAEQARVMSNQGDGLLVLPLAPYGVSLFRPDDEALLWAHGTWWFAVFVWTLFILWRVSGRPHGDTPRAAAILAQAGGACLLLPLSAQFLSWRLALTLSFPVIYVWGCCAMLMALRANPPKQPPLRRFVTLSAGGLLYLVGAVGALSPLLPLVKDGIAAADRLGLAYLAVAFISVFVSIGIAVLGCGLIAAGVRALQQPTPAAEAQQ